MRKLLFLLVFLLLLAIGLWWLTNVFALFGAKNSTFNQLPASTLAVFRTENVNRLVTEIKDGEEWEELKDFDWIAQFCDLQEQVALLFEGEENKVKKIPVTASLHLTAPQEYDYLLHINSSHLSWFRLRYFINKVEDKGLTLEKRTFNGIPIFEIKGESLKVPITLAQKGNTLLISPEATLVEEAVNERSPEIQNAVLEAFAQRSSNDLFTAYFHLKNLPFLNSMFTKADHATVFNYLENAATGFALTGKRSETQESWDVNGKWVWQGNNNQQRNNQKDLLKTELSKSSQLHLSDIIRIVPSNSALLLHQQSTEKPQATADILEVYQQSIESWLDDEWAWFVPEKQEGKLGSCLLVKSNDPARTRTVMNRWVTQLQPSEEELNYRNFLLKPLFDASFAQLFLKDFGKEHFQESWLTYIEDYVLIASDKPTLQAVLDQHISGQTLDKDDLYKKCLAESNTAGVGLLIQSQYLLPTLKLNPSSQFEKELKSKSSSISKYSPLFFSLNSDKISGNIQYGQSHEVSDITLWNAVLDAPPVSRPQVLSNDVTGKNEILVQDAKNILYLLNNEGQIEWKTELGGDVMGDIHLVNLYKNDERQYLFNTRNQIYMLDSRGDLVQNFPLRLSTSTSTGMLLFEENIFIACKNQQIYGYDLSGKLLNGWNPNDEVVGDINQPLTILSQKENWFLIAPNQSGTLTFLNRFGELEFVSILGSPLISPLEIDNREGFDVVVATCLDGKTYTINQEGTFWAKNYLPIDSTASFLNENILSSEAEELVFANKQYVSIFNTNEKLMEFNLGCEITELFTTQIEGLTTKRLGAFCENMQQAWLFDYNEVYEGFPISTTTPFVVTDLYDTNENFVISGGENNEVFAFKIK